MMTCTSSAPEICIIFLLPVEEKITRGIKKERIILSRISELQIMKQL